MSMKLQLLFTCPKLTIETLEQCVKYVKVNHKDTRTTPELCSGVSKVNFEHVIAGWDIDQLRYDQLQRRFLEPCQTSLMELFFLSGFSFTQTDDSMVKHR